jgi:hypothetical protein
MKGVIKHVQNNILFPKKGKVKGNLKKMREVDLTLQASSQSFGMNRQAKTSY